MAKADRSPPNPWHKERDEERERCFSPSHMPAEVNKMYMPLWLSNSKPAISCRLRAFDIRMTQHPYGESSIRLCTRASLEEFRRNNCSFQDLLFFFFCHNFFSYCSNLPVIVSTMRYCCTALVLSPQLLQNSIASPTLRSSYHTTFFTKSLIFGNTKITKYTNIVR